MTQYYFLSTLLPPLSLEEKPELSFAEFQKLMKVNLKPRDYAAAQVITRLIDLENLRAFWDQFPLDTHGGLSPSEVEEVIATHNTTSLSYLSEYLDRYTTIEERKAHFSFLLATYFREEIAHASGFLHNYLQFEREWRWVMVGLRCKQQGADLLEELQYEDPQEEVVAHLLAQKDATTYEPPEEYAELALLFKTSSVRPLEFHRGLLAYRMRHFQEFAEGQLFSIEVILSYLAQLILVEKWQELNVEKGRSLIEALLKVR